MTTTSKSFFIALLILSIFRAEGQYSISDKELVRATFLRDGKSLVVSDYLNSGDDRKVRAGLLAVANLNDSSLHSKIANCDYTKFGKFIAFALGCNSPSELSLSWLRKKINSERGVNTKYLLDAIGKIGDKTDLDKVLEIHESNNAALAEGISLAVANFALRGIKSERSPSVLLSLVSHKDFDNKTRSIAAYSLFRSRPSKDQIIKLKEILADVVRDDVTEEEEDLAKYLILSLRFLKVAPYTPKEVEFISFTLDFSQQIDLVSTLQFYDFKSKEDLDRLFGFMSNANGNFAITATTVLKNAMTDKKLMEAKFSDLEKLISSSVNKPALIEELLGTAFKLFPEKANSLFTGYRDRLSPASVAGLLGTKPDLLKHPADTLLSIYFSGNERVKLAAVTALGELRKSGRDSLMIQNFAVSQFTSGFASVVSTCCELLDSAFIVENKSKLETIIIKVVNDELNNPNFLEAHQSLLKLCESISADFAQTIKELFVNSAVSSIKALSGMKVPHSLSSNFDEIWNNAFKYRRAVIETEFGNIKLELYPGYAPVSVGNFCSLAQTSFYRDVLFHRVVPGFVIQAGDPSGTGWGGPGYDIISEYSPLEYTPGALGMASAGKDTEGSQFFIMTGTFPHLNSRYSLFGRVTEGQNIANEITQQSLIKKISLFE